MKKLILVTLTAFAASWLLSETRRAEMPNPPTEVRNAPLLVNDQPTTDEPGAIRTIPWRKGDGPRQKRGSAMAPASKPSPVAASKTPPPSWFPKSEFDEESKIDPFGFRVIVGRVSVSEERAKQDLRKAVQQAVSDWLAADVATTWPVPPEVLDAMVEAAYTQEVARNLIAPEIDPSKKPDAPAFDGLYTLYRAGQKLDFSPERKARIVEMYRKDVAAQRMQRLGGGLVLALVTLAVLSGYIKADEATKGYYTNRLRFVAAAGLGAAGAVVYRFLA